MVAVNFNPLWHRDMDHFHWTACSSLGGARGKARFGFPEYHVWTDLQRDVAWAFRGGRVVHGTWNEYGKEVFKSKRNLKKYGSIAWGEHQ